MDASRTLVDLFLETAARRSSSNALWYKQDGSYRVTTWGELARQVGQVAVSLSRLVAAGDRVAQLAENRWEWIVTDLAIQLARGIHVPIHAPLTAEQVAFQVRDSGARVVLASTPDQVEKLAAGAESLPEGLCVFSFDPCDTRVKGSPVAPFADLLVDADDAAAERLAEEARTQLGPDSLATILYTSGTTGDPKGVMLSQRNLVSNTLGTLAGIGLTGDEVRLNFLPLSHIFARTCDMYTWVAQGSELALAESRETVIADCAAVRPTVMNGVPYFFDKVRRALVDAGRADDPDALQQLLGGRVRFCCSGGAALPEHVFDFYERRGVPILQGYGLTESSPVITLSSEEHYRRGASGRAIQEVEIRIADDGEVLTRGPHVMVGYYKHPEATAEVVRDGWLYTGDLGRIDEDGFLYITGRKKEIIVTSGGKNIAPVQLEGLLTQDPLILQAVVLGDDRDYLTALIVPNPDTLREEIMRRGIAVASRDAALAHPQVLELFEEAIRRRLQGVSYYEQVRKFTLMNRGFTIESGELTPKLSLRRSVIAANCRPQIEAMYPRK